jgi:hypothetical protein
VPGRDVAETRTVTVAVAWPWRDGGGLAKRAAGKKARPQLVLGVRVCVPAVSLTSRVAAQRRRGGTAAAWTGQGQGSILAVGSGVHARTRVLASRDRSVAVPCAGYRRSGPVARRSGEEATAAAGNIGGAMGSCRRGRHKSREKGLGVLGLR